MRLRAVSHLFQRSLNLGMAYVGRFGPLRGLYILTKTYVLMNLSSSRRIAMLSLPDYPAPVYLRHGPTDRGIFTQVIVEEEYDLKFLLPNWQPEVIVDAGANVGYASLFFAQRYPRARIFALEPESSNFSLLEKNVQSYPHIIPIRAALWSRRAKLEIENPNDSKCNFRFKESNVGGQEGISTVTIQDLLDMLENRHIDLLKLDIEGGEKDLFENGAESWLDRVTVIAIELHDRYRPGSSAAVFAATDRYSFRRTDRKESTFLMRPDLESHG
jgi:FkbM family methyltransferase